MEDIDGGLHPAVDGHSLDEDGDEDCAIKGGFRGKLPISAAWSTTVVKKKNMQQR